MLKFLCFLSSVYYRMDTKGQQPWPKPEAGTSIETTSQQSPGDNQAQAKKIHSLAYTAGILPSNNESSNFNTHVEGSACPTAFLAEPPQGACRGVAMQNGSKWEEWNDADSEQNKICLVTSQHVHV